MEGDNMSNSWQVMDYEDGAFTIYDPTGAVRGKFGSPAKVAEHLAFAMEENDRLREENARLRKQVADVLARLWEAIAMSYPTTWTTLTTSPTPTKRRCSWNARSATTVGYTPTGSPWSAASAAARAGIWRSYGGRSGCTRPCEMILAELVKDEGALQVLARAFMVELTADPQFALLLREVVLMVYASTDEHSREGYVRLLLRACRERGATVRLSKCGVVVIDNGGRLSKDLRDALKIVSPGHHRGTFAQTHRQRENDVNTRERLKALVVAAVKLVIIRHGLATDDTPDMNEEDADELALDTWDALNGIHTCDGTVAPELKAANDLEDKVAALQRFKDFCHAYLDAHGVPHGDPDNPHQKEGCRIGARLDLLFAKLADAPKEGT